MKQFKKITAVVLAVLMIFEICFPDCCLDGQSVFSYRNDSCEKVVCVRIERQFSEVETLHEITSSVLSDCFKDVHNLVQ